MGIGPRTFTAPSTSITTCNALSGAYILSPLVFKKLFGFKINFHKSGLFCMGLEKLKDW